MCGDMGNRREAEVEQPSSVGLLTVREAIESDKDVWLSLFISYNEFYGRTGEAALSPDVLETTWSRMLSSDHPVHCLLAEMGGAPVGLAHCVMHWSTIRREPYLYMQDLFADPDFRGRGVGRALIDAVFRFGADKGCSRVYWHTHQTNARAMVLYNDVAGFSGFLMYKKEIAGRRTAG